MVVLVLWTPSHQIRCVEDEETANILLAHVTQLRSLWRFEHEQSAALRDLVGMP